MTNFPCIYPAPFGFVRLVFDSENRLLQLNLSPYPPEPAPFDVPAIWRQKLDAYFAGRLKDFGVSPNPQGTAFQLKVWAAVAQVPYGRTATYRDIALTIGSHPRAVGTACGKNPLSLIVPTHRIVPHGYRIGSAERNDPMYLRDWLLRHEGAV